MSVLAGIDEAGYGPTLGPLVVSASCFRIPTEMTDFDLWRHLDAAVRAGGRSNDGRLLVADSKKVYSRRKGIGGLEAPVLSFAEWAGTRPGSLGEALQKWAPSDAAAEDELPWHRSHELALPVDADASEIRNSADSLRTAGEGAGVEALALFCVPVYPPQFNRGVRRYGNKAAVLFLRSAAILQAMWRRWGEEGLHVFADKHGGRKRYGALLGRVFPKASIRIREQTHEVSTYTIREGAREMTLSFVVKGDDKYLPVALASMVSKYVRELHMMQFNAFWAHHIEGLIPTAGYPQDARRFLADVEDARRRLGIDMEVLVRIR